MPSVPRTGNARRPEVEALMDLLVNTVIGELAELHSNGVRLNTIGDIDSLPENCRNTLQEAIRRHGQERPYHHHLGLELQRPMGDRGNGPRNRNKGQVQGTWTRRRSTMRWLRNILPRTACRILNCFIRTSGEQRISNFLLWQIAYAELWFTPVLWPDFRKEHLFQAVLDFQSRQRRFGLVGEQITPRC